MRKGILSALIVLSVFTYLWNIHQNEEDSLFEEWKSMHSTEFSSLSQELYREHIFKSNLKLIQEHNSNPKNTYKLGLTQFAIYSQQEFASRFLMEPIIGTPQTDNIRAVIVDWTTAGAVTPVKNQGQCGSASAFTTVGGCQGLSKVAYGGLLSFSEQQIIDCSTPFGGQGCNGGSSNAGYAFVKAHGLSPTVEYPYTGRAGTCKIPEGSFRISDYKIVRSCDELVQAVKYQPVSVYVDATNWSLYRSGIFSNCKNSLNHGVLLTGLADQYWKIKNSWGSAWGESGYIRLARGDTCGICENAIYPVK